MVSDGALPAMPFVMPPYFDVYAGAAGYHTPPPHHAPPMYYAQRPYVHPAAPPFAPAPGEVRCQICDGLGHTAKSCGTPSPYNKSSSVYSCVNYLSKKFGETILMVNGVVNNVKTKVLIDTGAHKQAIVSKALFDKLKGCKHEPSTIRLKAADSNNLNVLGEAGITLKFPCGFDKLQCTVNNVYFLRELQLWEGIDVLDGGELYPVEDHTIPIYTINDLLSTDRIPPRVSKPCDLCESGISSVHGSCVCSSPKSLLVSASGQSISDNASTTCRDWNLGHLNHVVSSNYLTTNEYTNRGIELRETCSE